jgi:hypothetical protein
MNAPQEKPATKDLGPPMMDRLVWLAAAIFCGSHRSAVAPELAANAGARFAETILNHYRLFCRRGQAVPPENACPTCGAYTTTKYCSSACAQKGGAG